jgi:hypothetical protein
MSLDFSLTRRAFLEVLAGIYTITPSGRLHRRFELPTAKRVTLHAVVRDLFPHPRATEDAYARATTAIAARCRHDPQAFEDVVEGLGILERNCAGKFAEASNGRRMALLTRLRDGSFFQTVYGESMEAMYGSREAWLLFG